MRKNLHKIQWYGKDLDIKQVGSRSGKMMPILFDTDHDKASKKHKKYLNHLYNISQILSIKKF
jgi:hypothetical protein